MSIKNICNISIILTILTICILSTACSSEEKIETNVVNYVTSANINEMNFEYTDRDLSGKYDDNIANIKLSGDSASIEGTGASISSNKISINENGTYIVSGKLNDGQIYICGDNIKAQVVLNNAEIYNSCGPAIYIEQANKVFITMNDGTINSLSDGDNYTDDNESYGVIFSKDDLCINGSGQLSISANYKHAINCNDDLTITGGNYNITSKKDGIRANDSIKICDGVFSINSGSDCISVNKDDSEKEGYLVIDGGVYTLTSSNEALKSCTYIRINNGSFNINATDDAIHNNVIIDINGGDLSINAKDDAIHTESELNINGGKINISSCYEGLEAQKITINDGEVSITATDDPINASYAEWNSVNFEHQLDKQNINPTEPSQSNKIEHRDFDIFENNGQNIQGPDGQMPSQNQKGQEPPQMPNNPPQDNPGQNKMDEQQKNDFAGNGGMKLGNGECKLTINGGSVYTDSNGDGIDSNGDIEINGGNLIVNGPSSGGDSPIDYGENSKFTVNGGNVLAVGSSGMAESFTGGNQAFGMINKSGNKGSVVSLITASGKILSSLTATKAFQIILCSNPQLQENNTYNIMVDNSSQSFTASKDPNSFAIGIRQGFGIDNRNNNPTGQTPPGQGQPMFKLFSNLHNFFIQKAYADGINDDTESYKISGYISLDNEASLKEFEVFLDNSKEASFITDSDGKFMIENVNNGVHYITIKKNGYRECQTEYFTIEGADYIFGEVPVNAIEYKIVYNSNGGTGTVDPKTYKFDKEDNIRSNKFSKDSYKFKEWNTCADGSGQSYSEKQIVKNLTETDNSVITLYAQWKSNGGGGGGGGHEGGGGGHEGGGHNGGGNHESNNHIKTSSATKNHNEKSDSASHADKIKEASYNVNSDKEKNTDTIMSSIIKFAFGILAGSVLTICIYIFINYLKKRNNK